MTFFQKKLYFKKVGVAILAGVIKFVTMFIKKYLKTQENLEELKIMYLNGIYIWIS